MFWYAIQKNLKNGMMLACLRLVFGEVAITIDLDGLMAKFKPFAVGSRV